MCNLICSIEAYETTNPIINDDGISGGDRPITYDSTTDEIV